MEDSNLRQRIQSPLSLPLDERAVELESKLNLFNNFGYIHC